MKKNALLITYLQVAPLFLVLLLFVIVPLALVVAVSFFRYQVLVGLVPDFTFKNYIDILSNSTNWWLYFSTLKFTVIVLAITFVLGFWISYFLVFHVRNLLDRDCALPRLHRAVLDVEHHPHDLLAAGARQRGVDQLRAAQARVVNQPVEWLLFSDFSVIVAYVHLFTLFMIVPIFNSMARIDPALLEAAYDGGASRWGVVWNVVLPLSKTGIALGAVFVVTLVMGDFFVVSVMSGGLSGSATSGIFNDLQFLNYPRAAASAVILVIIVLMIAAAIFRLVDVRKELAR